MAAPTFVAANTQFSSSGVNSTTSIPWPAGHASGDIGILIIEQSGENTAIAPSNGTWTLISDQVDVASTAGSRFAVYWMRATSGAMGNANWPGGGTDHVLIRMYAFRGCVAAGDPVHVKAEDVKTTASATATMPSVTTTMTDLLIAFACSRPDDSSSTTHFGAPVNSNLTSLTAGTESGTVTGNGGGYTLSYGTQVTPGVQGTTTMTKTASTTECRCTFALLSTTSVTAATPSSIPRHRRIRPNLWRTRRQL